MLVKKNARSRIASFVRSAALAATGCAAFGAWAASVPAQVPLVSQFSDPPAPNVMLTIDDSGSMQAHYMPEGDVHFMVGGSQVTITLPKISSMNDLIDVFPNDGIVRNYGGQIPKGVALGDSTDTGNNFQRQMRSADVNSIFYNPAVLYLPWVKVAKTAPYAVTRYPDGNFTNAYWNPADTSRGSIDLSQAWTPPIGSANGTQWYWCQNGTVGAACTLETRVFHPGLFYVLTPGADPNKPASYQQYDLDDPSTSIPPASAARVCTAWSGCCPTGTCSLAQERQNFANWFVYYRSRTHLMKGGLSEALANEVGKIRVGFGTINTGTRTIDNVSGKVVQLGMRDLTAAQLSTVVNQLQGLNPSGSTPLREATISIGNYFRRDAKSDPGSPYRNVPGTSSDGQTPLACRRSYNLMTTDGYYNDPDGSVGDVDSVDGPAYGLDGKVSTGNPNGYSPNRYVAGHPYSDGQKNMLADHAMANYVNDLQPNMPNTVAPIPGGDPAYWQHLSTFTVGLGVTGTLPYPGALPDLISGNASWGSDRIDDLWHAAVDTQGGYFSVKDAPSLATALGTALGRAAAQSASDSGVALSSATILPGTAEYITTYSSGIWTGDIGAYPLDAAGNRVGTQPTWTASDKLPKPFSARNLYTVDGSSSVKFSASNASGNWRTLLGMPDTASQNNLINFIAGDQSNEGVGKPFRVRASVLGDFVDSPLLFVKNFVDLGYDNLASTAPGYRDYITNVKNQRASGVLFEGANDGMLHAFRSDTGAEVYGYVPNAVLHNLSILTQLSYGSPGANFHTDFVDGSQIETDAFIQTKRDKQGGLGATWSNIVAGSFGAGAPGFYALDTTDLATFDANTVLWEINASTPGYGADIGYVYSNIAVGVLPASGSVGSLANASWKAFVGNGVYSQNGHAALLVVDLATGNIDKELVLDNGSGNGLMGVQLVHDAKKEVVAAYAGDMKGNLWRIEFTGANAPVVGFGGPLFQAGATQPIVAPPSVYPNPAGGNIVLFGTGKLIDTADQGSTDPQTFYAIWDKTPSGTSSEGKPSLFGANPRSQLQQQTIVPDGPGLYNVNAAAPNYTTQLGWYMDLTPVSPKQRVIYPATVLSNYVLVNTMSPAGTPADQCDETLGTSAYFLLPILTGVPSTSPVWDTNGDGVVDVSDSADAGYSTGFGGKTTIGWFPVPAGSPPGTQPQCDNMNKHGNKGCKIPFDGPGAIKSRVWKQLMTPPF